MDHLKRRTIILIAGILACLVVLAPTFFPDQLPSWFPFKKKITLGLDLQGGSHIVYSIDLETAVVDRATDIKRDLETRFAEEPKINATVKTPLVPIGAVTVIAPDPAKKAVIESQIRSDRGSEIEWIDCPPEDLPNGLCFKVSSEYADGIKKDALTNAVTTIRERIDEKGVAEPTVVEQDDQIIVELPGLDEDTKQETRELIARTAKLEFKVVDNNAPFMQALFKHVEGEAGRPKDPRAVRDEILANVDVWRVEGGGQNQDPYLIAHDRQEEVPLAEAREIGCLRQDAKRLTVGELIDLFTSRAQAISARTDPALGGERRRCTLTGKYVLERYLRDLAKQDPAFKVPDDRQILFELNQPQPDAKDKRKYWRSYYLDRAVRLTGTAISNAMPSYDPNTNRPVVLLDFNRYGSRVFGDLTAEIVGKKLATVLDEKVKSAPVINQTIRGSASIEMGGGDAQRQETERDELVNVLKTGSLPAPLREEQVSELGPTIGRDAIAKTQLSFLLGILLVIAIMVGVYRWSGWVAVFAVVFHILVTLAVMALFGATLTLPGIAALVLSVGMEVDGNILIYERIRDELLLGKSVRGAVDLGFSRAFSAIFDGQLTIAASAWVLLNYGSGPIKGFAVMMLVGAFTTIATNTWVTRVIFDWSVARKKSPSSTLSI